MGQAKELVFGHQKLWADRYYDQKKVKVVYMEEEEIVVVTVLAYYGRWS